MQTSNPAGDGPICVPNPILLAQPRACRADEDCACGSGCELGRCVSACSSDAQCNGGTCDTFGRCRAPGDISKVPAVQRVGDLRVETSTALLQLASTNEARPFNVSVSGKRTGPVRILAGTGVEVRCGSQGNFAAECTFDAMTGGSSQTAWARAVSVPASTPSSKDVRRKLQALGGGMDASKVTVFAGDSVTSISVTAEPAVAPPSTDALAPGLYRGTARLIAAGVGPDPGAGQATGEIALQLTARVYANNVIALEDARHVLHPTGTWIGRVDGAGALRTVDFPSVPYLESNSWTGMPVEVIADAPPAALKLRGSTLAFELPVKFSGILPPARAPFVRWAVALGRTGELSATDAQGPTMPSDAVAKLSVERGAQPTPWEAAALSAIGVENVLTTTDARRRALLSAFSLKPAAGGTLAACTLDAPQIENLSRFAADEAWGANPGTDVQSALKPGLNQLVAGAFAASAVTPAMTTTLTSSERARSIPCAASFVAQDSGSTCAPNTRYRLGELDLCAALADQYGCEVSEVSNATLSVAVSGSLAGACSETLPPQTITGKLNRVCRLPAVPQGCAEMALCYAPPAAPADITPESLAATRFGDQLVTTSGDLLCADGQHSLFAADIAFAKAPCAAADPACDRLHAGTLIDACAADIARTQAAPPSGLPKYAAGLAQLFASSPKCVDAARMLTALGFATESDRLRTREPGTANTALASRVAQRLLARLFAYGAFTAREAAQRELLGEMFRSTPAGRNLPTVEQTLAKVLPLWDLVLHPRFAGALDQIPAPALATPDYRPLVLGRAVPINPEYEQTTGLPVAWVDMLNAQLALIEPRLEWAALDRDVASLDSIDTALRYALIARPLVSALVERAGPTVSWRGRYESAASELDAHMRRIGIASDSLITGSNPLGIEDDDLPLYFFGDEETPTTRFSAISDFLIGQMPGSVVSGSTWAPNLVDIARQSWEATLPLYIDQLDRAIQNRQSEADLNATLDGIRLDYGNRIASLCYPDHLATRDLLEKWEFDENSCFYRSQDPKCAVSSTDGAPFDQDRVRYQMCLVREVRRQVPSVAFLQQELNQMVDLFAEGKCMVNYSAEPDASCEAKYGSGAKCASCAAGGATVIAPILPDTFRSLVGTSDLPEAVSQGAVSACMAEFPSANTQPPSRDEVPGSPVTLRDCYSGGIGEAVFDLKAAEQELTEARVEFESIQARYDLAMKSCFNLQTEESKRAALTSAHSEVMRNLGIAKLTMDTISNLCGAAADCMGLLSQTSAEDTILLAGTNLVLAGVSCGLRTTAAALDSAITGVEFGMDEAERGHANALAALEAGTEYANCVNEASIELVAERAALVRVQEAAHEIDANAYKIQEMKITAKTYWDDGRAALEAAKARYVAPLAHDFWIGDKISSFWRDMRLARRVTYLAVRAVEYEMQQSLALRDTTLRARLPDQLWTVLDELWSMAGQRSVRGNRPTDLKVVLSLRENLLQLDDRSNAPAGEQSLSEVERFRMLLTAKRHAVYDEATGAYLGQRIPFTLAPLGALKLGQAQGIPVLAGGDCAERVWSVNASVLGENGLYVGNAPSFTRIDLLKSNTFFSQWCGGKPDAAAPDFQIASVRPSRNLFRDPIFGTANGVGNALGLGNETGAESRARIEAYFNVDRTAFEDDGYANGATSELAARGLYGDYALFIPAEVISFDGSPGLALHNVDDILLRLDYVSVAR